MSGGYGDRLRQGLDAIAKSPHKDRMVLFANVNFEGVGTPGWSQKAERTFLNSSGFATRAWRPRCSGTSSR